MKTFARLALGTLLLAGATAVTMAPADARVSIGIGIGVPGIGYGYGPGPRYYAACDPYSAYYDPYYCDDYGQGAYWDDPVYIDGAWLSGPFRWRMDRGRREFWVHGGWRGDEWRGGARPEFHGGGWRGERDWRGEHDWHGGGHDWHGDHGGHDWHH